MHKALIWDFHQWFCRRVKLTSLPGGVRGGYFPEPHIVNFKRNAGFHLVGPLYIGLVSSNFVYLDFHKFLIYV